MDCDKQELLDSLKEAIDRIENQDDVAGAKDLHKQLIAFHGENIVMQAIGAEPANTTGYDLYRKEKYRRVQVKAAYYSSKDNWIGAYNIHKSRGKFDYLAFVNMAENRRFSMIPHDELFKYLDKGNRNGNTRNRFSISRSLGRTNNIQPEATQLFLEHEFV